MKKINAKIIMFAAEILAVAALRAIYMMRRERTLPRAGKVGRMRGRPVYKPFKPPERPPEVEREEPEDPLLGIYTPPPKE